jgi:hypothetical protein
MEFVFGIGFGCVQLTLGMNLVLEIWFSTPHILQEAQIRVYIFSKIANQQKKEKGMNTKYRCQ